MPAQKDRLWKPALASGALRIVLFCLLIAARVHEERQKQKQA
jgi:hypothetical protein